MVSQSHHGNSGQLKCSVCGRWCNGSPYGLAIINVCHRAKCHEVYHKNATVIHLRPEGKHVPIACTGCGKESGATVHEDALPYVKESLCAECRPEGALTIVGG